VKLTLVRNACLLLETGGRRILVDPMLRRAGTTPPIENTPNPLPNPLVELPIPAEEVVRGIDGCIVTHLHQDHFDDTAAQLLPRSLPMLTQPESARRFAAGASPASRTPTTAGSASASRSPAVGTGPA
jgi:L-ascorbate metabolism protein UlaG (beta-lactamase superfamily)